MRKAVEDEALARQQRQIAVAVQPLHRLLYLYPGDNRGGRRRGRHLALHHVLTGEQSTRAPHVHKLVVLRGHRALVTGAVRGDERPRDTVHHLDGAVHPGLAQLPAHLVYEQPRLAVVQAPEDDVDLKEHAGADVMQDVGLSGLHAHIGVEPPHGLGRHDGLGPPRILVGEQHAARQVGVLDGVEIEDEDLADAQQSEVLADLVAQSPGADHHDPSATEALLIPPGDQTQPRIAVLIEVDVQGSRALAGVGSHASPP